MPEDALAEDFAEAVRRHESGDLSGAETGYHRIIASDPRHAGALHLLGVLTHQRGRHEEALATIASAIALDPSRAIFHNNQGVVLGTLGRLDEAMAAYREAIRLRPSYADAHSNLGAILHLLHWQDEAVAEFEEALRLRPAHVDDLFNLGNLQYDQGNAERAIELFERALKLAPNRADIWNNLGTAHGAREAHEHAAQAFRRAVSLNTGSTNVLVNLATALAHQDLIEEAKECYQAASRLSPDDPRWPLYSASLCPAVFHSKRAIERYRADLESVLGTYQGSQLPWDAAHARDSGCIPPFNLAHHGNDDRRLRSKFAGLYREAAARPTACSRSSKHRIGFVVTHPHEGVFIRCAAGLISKLDLERFDPVVLGSVHGIEMLRRSIVHPGATFVAFPDGFPEAAAQIKAAECDLLYHWEVGTDRLNYCLPFARLAPVQCTSWGLQVTSGVPAIDYYISSDLVESPSAEAHYTEALVRLPSLLCYTERVARPSPPVDRAEFGLPNDAHLYVCLQRPQKLHPDFDPLLGEILRRDTAGLLILLKGPSKRIAEALTARLVETLPNVRDRIALFPILDPARYHRLLSLADVVLDPLHYGAGSSAYDIFSYDLPLVTLPGAYNASRYAQACYRQLGLADLVTRSPLEYVETAVQLGTDRAFRDSWVARIAAATPSLFNDINVVRAHEQFFDVAVNKLHPAAR